MQLIGLVLSILGFFSFFYFRYTNGIVVVLGTLGVVYTIVRVVKEKRKDYINGLLILSVLGFAWSTLSYFWVINVDDWKYSNMFFYMGLCFVIMFNYAIKDKQLINKLSTMFLFVILIHNLLGLYEVITGNYLFFDNLSNIELYRELHYPVTFFYNTNDFSFFLLCATIFLLNVDTSNIYLLSKKWGNAFKIGLLISSIVLVFFTKSRSIILTIFLIFLIKIFFLIKCRRYQKYYLYALIALFLILTLFVIFNFNKLIEIVRNDPSGTVRLSLIRETMQALRETNYIGAGAGNLKKYILVGTIDVPHNWWLEILSTYGIVFFMIYIVYYLYNMSKLFYLSVMTNNWVYIMSLMWLVGFIIGSITPSSIFFEVWAWYVNAFVFSIAAQTRLKDMEYNGTNVFLDKTIGGNHESMLSDK